MAAALLGMTTPVLAAPLLDKTTVPAGGRAQIAMRVPSEGRGAVNKKLIVHLPLGFVADSCSSGGGWHCSIARVRRPTRAILTYEWADPAVPPSTDLVGFVVHAPRTPGSFRVEIDQFFADGHVFYWGGSPNKVAPSLTVTDATTTIVQVAPTGPGVANSRHVTPAPKKRDSNLMAIYVVIALWLAVVIPVLITGMKGSEGADAHAHDHH